MTDEWNALMDLFEHTNGKAWKKRKNWGSVEVHVSEWFGITCNDDGHVLKVQLATNNLTGGIPESLFTHLPYLQVLDLRMNNLIGPLPDSIGDARLLQRLTLQCNRLQGCLPTALGCLQRLEILDVSSNQLVGTFPLAISSCACLYYVAINSNLCDCTEGDIRSVIPGCRVIVADLK